MITKNYEQPKVELLNFTPLRVADLAISKCWDKSCDLDKPNEEKIYRVANKFKHASTIEHLQMSFDISNISRALLQELARHRMSNFSVKSTRYTLKELKSEEPFLDYNNELDFKRASQYVIWTDIHNVDIIIFYMLDDLRSLVKEGISNDKLKYALPEAYKTSLVWSVNLRSLQNFLSLRTDKSALWEIRNLAHEIYKQTPEEYRFLLKEFVKPEIKG